MRIQQRKIKASINRHQQFHGSRGPDPARMIPTWWGTVLALRAGLLADFMAFKIQRRGSARLACPCCRLVTCFFFIAEDARCKICCSLTCKAGRAGDQSS